MSQYKESLAPVSEQAAHWWIVFNDGAVSKSERRGFAEWVGRSPERVAAYLRVAQVHSAVTNAEGGWPAKSAAELIRDALAAPADPVYLPLRQRPVQRRAEPTTRRFALALAASVLIAVCIGWWTLSRPRQFQTEIGQQRAVVLGDGSRVTLNTASQIEVRLRSGERRIDLIKGEALFEVAHDSTRPFNVHAGAAVVRAVGTVFDVDRRADRTTVTVVEGRVAVNEQRSRFPVLTASDRITVGINGSGQLERGVDVAAATAWMQQQLVFQRRPLGEVVEEINRYNAGRIEIRSPALRDEPITGRFSSNDAAMFASFIAGIPGAHVETDGKGGFIVTRVPDAP
ncbi:FecR family protein [Povalibacter sp.]|uniref:FecR family protein n=1 Tax=Povalibacter sp. TaxID=1962978 RepID=UPI002F40CAED